MADELDLRYMSEALALARLGWGRTTPNPMVGAVLVKGDRIIGRGFHQKAGSGHAEVNAFADAEKNGEECTGATLYVTLEPCSSYGRTPPCTEAILHHRVRRVVAATVDPNPKHAGRGLEILRQAGIEIESGVLAREAAKLNEPFFKWISTGRPWVILKMAQTLDGCIATASGDSRWVTGEAARSRVQQLRRLADAVMVGGETARVDHPRLTVRDPEEWPCQPLRIIASKSMSEAELAELFPDGNAELATPEDAAGWQALLDDLGKRSVVTLLIEGGGELAASALRCHAVDYVEFHIAPKLLGGRTSRHSVGGSDPEAMAEALSLEELQITPYGDDLAVSGYPVYPEKGEA